MHECGMVGNWPIQVIALNRVHAEPVQAHEKMWLGSHGHANKRSVSFLYRDFLKTLDFRL